MLCFAVVISSAVRPSSFLRKFSHFQFVLLAGLVSIVLLIIEVCLTVLWFCCHQKTQESQKDLEWKGTLTVSSPAPCLVLNFPCFKSWLLPLASSLCRSEESLALSCLYPPSEYICICCLQISLFSGVNKPCSFSLSNQSSRQDFLR